MGEVTDIEHGVSISYKEVRHRGTGHRTGSYKRSGSCYFVCCYDAEGEVIENRDFATSGSRDSFIASYPNASVRRRREQVTNI